MSSPEDGFPQGYIYVRYVREMYIYQVYFMLSIYTRYALSVIGHFRSIHTATGANFTSSLLSKVYELQGFFADAYRLTIKALPRRLHNERVNRIRSLQKILTACSVF